MIYGYKGGLDDLRAVVDMTTRLLGDHRSEFDFIACSGMSGVVVAAPVSLALHKPVVIVRKPEDQNLHHRGSDVISDKQARGAYVIVDDFISSGRTLKFIWETLDKLKDSKFDVFTCRIASFPLDNPPVLAGAFLYGEGQSGWMPARELYWVSEDSGDR